MLDPNDISAGEYPAIGHAYISDDGALCVEWRAQRVLLVISPDGMGLIMTGTNYTAGREVSLNGEWPDELRCVMSDDYVDTLRCSAGKRISRDALEVAANVR